MAARRDAQGRFVSKSPETLSPDYARRLARGARRGFSLSRTRGHATKALPMWQTREVFTRPAYRTALDVLTKMRHGKSLYQASRAAHIAPDTVQRYVGAALVRGRDGRYHAAANDHLYRLMVFLDEHGRIDVEVANAHEARKLASYWSDIDHYLRTGVDRPLRRYERIRLLLRDKSVRRFVTDPAILDRLAHAGELSFEDLYQLAA
jgi:hypothetical protein